MTADCSRRVGCGQEEMMMMILTPSKADLPIFPFPLPLPLPPPDRRFGIHDLDFRLVGAHGTGSNGIR